MMTNKEMGDKIQAALGTPMGVSLSKEGKFLTIGDERFEVTEIQCEILWDLLPQVARINAAIHAERRSAAVSGKDGGAAT